MNPSVWGPSFWYVIHTSALYYNTEDKAGFKNFINSLVYTLPCKKCRLHLSENLTKLPLDDYLKDNEQMFLWTYLLHDMVNKQLKKVYGCNGNYSSPPFQEMYEKYRMKEEI